MFKAGSFINVPGMFKETPLHDAARNGHYKVIRVKIEIIYPSKNIYFQFLKREVTLISIQDVSMSI